MGSGGDNCGLPDGVIHMHSGRCYEAGRREVIARAEAAEAAVERVREAFDPGELDCGRLGFDCHDVLPPDRWCRACRIVAALEGR